MARKRDGLVPIGEALSGLDDGPVQAIREAASQARQGFTLADQVNQLVSASEADPDLGFMARMMALCSLPRSNPGHQLQYVRRNGPFVLYMIAGGGSKLPFGNLPRLLLAWVSTEAVRTQSRELVLGRSLSEFMRSLGINSDSGGARGEQTRLRNQMNRLFGCTVSLIYEDENRRATVNALIARRTEFWWNPKAARRERAVGEQDRTQRGLFQRNHQPSGTPRHEHPEGPQTLLAGLGSVPMGHLPNLCPHASATALLASGVPSVWSTPGPSR